jgi:hypothetical protein
VRIASAPGRVFVFAIAGVTGQLACGSLLAIEDDPPASGASSGSPTANEGGSASAEGGLVPPGATVDGGDAATDAPVNTSFGACGTDFTDAFEGGMFRTEWTDIERPTVNHVQLVTTPVHAGAGALRFKTVAFSDVTSIGHRLTGSCPLLLDAWFRVTGTSGQDNSGLITIERGAEAAIRIVLQDTRLRMLEAGTDKAYTADYVRDAYNQVHVEYYPATGEVQLRLNSDAKRIAIVTPAAPTELRLGIRGASDGGQGADEVFLDDVTVRH